MPISIKNNPRVSQDQLSKMIKGGKKIDAIYSFFPIDKHDCECRGEVNHVKTLLSGMNEKQRHDYKRKIGHIVCPKSKKAGFKRYQIVCANCGETVAFVSAKDALLTEWCDLHYYNYAKRITLLRKVKEPDIYQRGPKKGEQKLDKNKRPVFKIKEERIPTGRWFGCATVNLSPIDQKLGFECFCGNDTRDFRSSATLPPNEIHARLRKREFGKAYSGYLVREVRK